MVCSRDKREGWGWAGLDRTKMRSDLSEAEAQGVRLRVFPAIVEGVGSYSGRRLVKTRIVRLQRRAGTTAMV